MTISATTPIRASQPANERLLTFDFARGILIILMVLVHVLDFYGDTSTRESLVGSTIRLLANWQVAAWFVFIMGMFITYSGQQSLSTGLKRALGLFALGYALNIARGSIPMWLSLQFGLVTQEQLGSYTPTTEFFIVDILQFAGLALACCLLVKHLLPEPKHWLISALLVTFASPSIWDTSTGWIYIDSVLKLLFGNVNQGAMFPLFPWLAYPLVGMAFGHWLRKSCNIREFFQKSLWVGTAIIAVGLPITITDTAYHMASNMRPGPGMVISLTGGALVFLWLCQRLTENQSANRFVSLLCFWGRNVTTYYVIQWLLIGWGLMLVGSQQLPQIAAISAMLVVMALSHFGVLLWLKIHNVRSMKIA
ncbi:heparan-alpha-glucosaminide N-acetyltransferase domain-containing protein [Alteromonas sp. CI.11.F.A3]|uniref:heparan-alpha-glucosaminide N-acetyltransferase domain-containing protein n=1 Tax=Alteromonas sp. CI.11.F.A3 TaxID=3079555 RepID=UPI002943BCBE|nr:heparan-alpha-glucosaminide N-acetyltransferase domain-containing protein [Alteromonas sp. CI.11.F.A3]WOI38319.1 heparan-alpha-glucosaminide N-acetyltransferase domain-containing protein [Alteromonas sp. CI.11.F.A3]